MRNIIIISDLHCGCQFGLCNGIVRLDGGGTYIPNRFQKEVYKNFNEFWGEWVPRVTKNEPYIVVINGDAIDGNHHNSTTQISHNLETQSRIALTCIEPVLDSKKCKGYYHVRGTEAHVGPSAQEEERLARELGAIPDDLGNHARNDLWIEMDKQLIHFAHHVGTSSSSSYESTAVYKELIEAYTEAGRWNEKPPTIIVRSHRHRAFKIEVPAENSAVENGFATAIVTPGWQLRTPFVYKLASGRSGAPQIGGILIRAGHEDGLFTRSRTWKMKRPKIEIV